MQDWRRLNVALTRAKTKLICFGCHRTLKRSEGAVQLLFNLLQEQQWLYDLQKDAHLMHPELDAKIKSLHDSVDSSVASANALLQKQAAGTPRRPNESSALQKSQVSRRIAMRNTLERSPILRDILNEQT